MALRKSSKGFGTTVINLLCPDGIDDRNVLISQIRAESQSVAIAERPAYGQLTFVFVARFNTGLTCFPEQRNNLSVPNR